MSYPNGEQAESQYTPSSAPVPQQPSAPETEQVPPPAYEAPSASFQAATPSYEPAPSSYQSQPPSYEPAPSSAQSQPSSFEPASSSYQSAPQSYEPVHASFEPAQPTSSGSGFVPPSATPQYASPVQAFPGTAQPTGVQPVPPGVMGQPGQVGDPATQPVYSPGAAAMPAGAGYTPEGGTSSFPVTGAPVSGYPVSGYPVAAEPKKKRTGTILLTIATIVLGLATAGLGTMYYLEYDKRTKADKKISEQTTALADADKKIKDTESKLSTKTEEVGKLNQDLTGNKNKLDEVTKARDAMAACFQAIEAYNAAKNSTNAVAVVVKCTEAEKYY